MKTQMLKVIERIAKHPKHAHKNLDRDLMNDLANAFCLELNKPYFKEAVSRPTK